MQPAVGGNSSPEGLWPQRRPRGGIWGRVPREPWKEGSQGWGEGTGAEEEEVSPLDTLILHCSWILALPAPCHLPPPGETSTCVLGSGGGHWPRTGPRRD